MDNIIRFRDDEAASQAAIAIDNLAAQTNASAVRIEPGDDARILLPYLDQIQLVEVNFPVFGDGRGYSAARILREAGYKGEIRAVGDVLADQIGNMKRCGFDAFEPDQPIAPDDVENAFNRWPDVYQATADGRNPIWNIRHGIKSGQE